MHATAFRLMVALVSRMWTPFITPRTTESLTCWTSVTWRAGEGGTPAPRLSHIRQVSYLRFDSSQGLGSDCRLDGLQHLVHQTVLQGPAYRKCGLVDLYLDGSHVADGPRLCNFAAVSKCFGDVGSR